MPIVSLHRLPGGARTCPLQADRGIVYYKVTVQREYNDRGVSARALIVPSAFRRAQIILSPERKVSAGSIILIARCLATA